MNQAKAIRGEQDSAVIRRAASIETEIGHILAGEEELLPSSGFVVSVMERVQEEAALPTPVPFPWMRASLILLLASGVFGWGAVELIHWGLPVFGQLGLGLTAQSWWTISPQHLSADLVRTLE